MEWNWAISGNKREINVGLGSKRGQDRDRDRCERQREKRGMYTQRKKREVKLHGEQNERTNDKLEKIFAVYVMNKDLYS